VSDAMSAPDEIWVPVELLCCFADSLSDMAVNASGSQVRSFRGITCEFAEVFCGNVGDDEATNAILASNGEIEL